MKILVSIPCLFNGAMCNEAIASVAEKEFVSVLLIDNGSDEDVKEVINKWSKLPNVYVINNPQNVYVNKAWGQAVDFFVNNIEYSHLIIMNSDLVMHSKWDRVLINRLAENINEITIPKVIDDKFFNGNDIDMSVSESEKVYSGTAGIFIVLSRKLVELINPIPTECLVWFGDQYIYTVLRSLGYETVIPNNLLCYHAHSQTVSRVPGISEIIERDKIAWNEIVEPRMLDLIEKLKK